MVWRCKFYKEYNSSGTSGTHNLFIKIVCSPQKSRETIPLKWIATGILDFLLNLVWWISNSTWLSWCVRDPVGPEQVGEGEEAPQGGEGAWTQGSPPRQNCCSRQVTQHTDLITSQGFRADFVLNGSSLKPENGNGSLYSAFFLTSVSDPDPHGSA